MVGTIGSAYFVGLLLSMFILPRIADLYGRRRPILVCQFIQLPVLVYFFFMRNWIEVALCFLLLGFAVGGSVVVCSIYTQEFLQKAYRSIVLAISATFEGLALLLATIYFLYVTKDWRYWYYAMVII